MGMPDSAGTADSPGMVVQWHMAAGARTAAAPAAVAAMAGAAGTAAVAETAAR